MLDRAHIQVVIVIMRNHHCIDILEILKRDWRRMETSRANAAKGRGVV